MITKVPFKPFLPSKPEKPYIPPQRGKAVTIAVSIRCEHGVILCADRLMTHGGPDKLGSFAHYEPKVFADEGRYFAAAVTGAGATFELRAFAQSFLKSARLSESEDATSLPDIPSILNTELENLASRLPATPELDLLVAEVVPPWTFRVFTLDFSRI